MCCGQKRSNLQQSPLSSARQNAHKVGNSRSQAVRTQPSMPLPAGNVSPPQRLQARCLGGEPDVAVCRPSLCGELTHPSARTRQWCELRVFGHSRRSGSGRQRRLLFVEHSFFPSRLKVWFVYRLLFVERAEVLLRRERDVGDRLLVVGVWISDRGSSSRWCPRRGTPRSRAECACSRVHAPLQSSSRDRRGVRRCIALAS